jgi:hypothetical protein
MKVNLVINHKTITIRPEKHINTNMESKLVEILSLHSCSCSYSCWLYFPVVVVGCICLLKLQLPVIVVSRQLQFPVV